MILAQALSVLRDELAGANEAAFDNDLAIQGALEGNCLSLEQAAAHVHAQTSFVQALQIYYHSEDNVA
jgi:hypothetical protein